MSRPIKVFIFEGEKTEIRYAEAMKRSFFDQNKIEIINLPAKQNIYMLYETLKEDDFDTDLIELLKEKYEFIREELGEITSQDIEEIYLFFDYDAHQNNSREENVLADMLEVFDNETENGKLYVSYPMVESIYDYKEGKCDAFSFCFYPVAGMKQYKRNVGENNPKASRHFEKEEWKEVLHLFSERIKCLFGDYDLDFRQYREKINSMSIFEKQDELVKNTGCVFVLSAFPEFLFDYFKKEFWDAYWGNRKLTYDYCSKK